MRVADFNKQFYFLAQAATNKIDELTKTIAGPEIVPIEKDETFEALAQAIENRESIVIKQNGTWYKNRWIVALFRRIVGKNEELLTARQLARYLAKPIMVKEANIQGYTQHNKLTQQQIERLVSAVKVSLASLTKKEDAALEEAKKNREILKNSPSFTFPELVEFTRNSFDKRNFPACATLTALQQAQIASLYLGIKQEDISQTVESKEDLAWMQKQVEAWQERTFPTVNFLQGSYRKGTLEKIARCCKYKKFIEIARVNPHLLELLFQTILRNAPKNSIDAVDIFLQTPQIQRELHVSYLDMRIQHIQNNGLKIEEFVDKKSGKIAKDVSLLIGGVHQSITDPSRIVKISEKIQMTVRKLFETFKKGLDHGFIEIEYMQDTGIGEFDGRCTTIDFSKKNWWKDIPVIERLTRAEASEKYDVDFSKGKALFVLRASRKYPDLHAQDTHSWIDLVLPLDDGTFNAISIGKFSKTYPVGLKQTLDHICMARPSEFTVVDPNKFYSWRERVHFAFPPMNEETFSRCMDKIGQDFVRCREGKDYFQAQGENCAKWVEGTIKSVFPEFKLDLFNTKFAEALSPPITPLLRFGDAFRIFVCTLFFGVWRGVDFLNEDGTKRTVRLINNPDWLKGILRVPGRICEKDRAEEIRNEIAQLPQDSTFANEDEKEFSPEEPSEKTLKEGVLNTTEDSLQPELPVGALQAVAVN